MEGSFCNSGLRCIVHHALSVQVLAMDYLDEVVPKCILAIRTTAIQSIFRLGHSQLLLRHVLSKKRTCLCSGMG